MSSLPMFHRICPIFFCCFKEEGKSSLCAYIVRAAEVEFTLDMNLDRLTFTQLYYYFKIFWRQCATAYPVPKAHHAH